ncbi:peptidoglycan editing factor PgeF [Halobacillus litoralis]|uniref:peptidoglycan editing factor PgeF n=1 Tax=Halobacillus litoralis TaxID=45668 RepID=UPI001CFE5217|nr:peptidoglycan editing factor PgeF [Halobacillus litoralis]
MEPFKQKSIRQYRCFDSYTNITAGLTTRNGGHSEPPFDTLNMGLHVSDDSEKVIRNRNRLAEELDLSMKQWIIGEQVHGTKIQVVDRSMTGSGALSLDSAVQGVDGLITNETDLVLGAFYADCVPLYFYDPVAEWVGIAHAGWKGTVNGMAAEMVNALREKGCHPKNIQAVVGPSISQRHYEVDQKVMDHIPDPYKQVCAEKNAAGKYQLDLKALHKKIMIENGVPEGNIQVSGACTYEEKTLFYSHRRDQGKTGRMLGFIALRA